MSYFNYESKIDLFWYLNVISSSCPKHIFDNVKTHFNIVPEPDKYRVLEDYEIIQKGDQLLFQPNTDWIDCWFTIGATVKSQRPAIFRRRLPVKTQLESDNENLKKQLDDAKVEIDLLKVKLRGTDTAVKVYKELQKNLHDETECFVIVDKLINRNQNLTNENKLLKEKLDNIKKAL